MSRSYRHTPIGGICGSGHCKQWRTQENRRYRAYVKNLIRHEKYDDIQDYCGKFGNEWDSPRDGKTHWFNMQYWECGEYSKQRYSLLYKCKDNDHWHCKIEYKRLMRK